MRMYIVNLTDNLIGTLRLEELFNGSSSPKDFLSTVDRLLYGEVQHWSPETLGKVIGSIEQLECPEMDNLAFVPAPMAFLRLLASKLLARSILYRLEVACGKPHGKIPAYTRRSEWPRLP